MGQRRFPHGGVNIYPVDHRIGSAEMVAEGPAGLNTHHLFPIHRIHHRDVVGKDRPLARHITDAQTIQRRKAFGPSWIPAPISPISCAFSSSITLIP